MNNDIYFIIVNSLASVFNYVGADYDKDLDDKKSTIGIYYFRWNFVGEDVHKRECNIYVDKFATTQEVQTLFGFALSYYRLK